METALDQARLNFSPHGVLIINAILAFIMYGVALDIRVEDFRRIASEPRGPLIGLAAQFVALPAITFLLILLLRPQPSIALGMILVAACPGGNVSNFVTQISRGNTALSVSMTAVSSFAAVFLTPLNLALWGSLHPETAALLRSVDVSTADILLTVSLILGLPLAAGMVTRARAPALTERIRRPISIVSSVLLLAFIAAAFVANFSHLVAFGLTTFPIVILHNAVALGLGYATAALFRLRERDRRAIAMEVGIQNSALGLALIFGFFDGLGGMAIIAASWGIWHIVAGLTLSTWWSQHPPDPSMTLTKETSYGATA